MKKWLITGGCGFLGSNIADEVLSQGEEVVILDNLSRFGSDRNLEWLRTKHGPEWRFVNEDTRNAEAVAALVKEEKPDVIAHLAGQVAMTTSLSNPRYDFEVNALGSFNVLEAVRAHQDEAVILYSSTNKVYGDLDWVNYEETKTRFIATDYPKGFDETIPLDFASPYGCSKGSADQYMLDYARMFGLRTIVFRHSSMYGGRQYSTFDQGWIGWFCGEALRQKKGDKSPFTISGNGKQVRDLLHADDMRVLYTTAVEKADSLMGHAFNIGGGIAQSLSVLELLSMLENMLNISLSVEHIAPRSSDQRVFVAQLDKIRSLTGWQPVVGSSAGVSRMLEWAGEPILLKEP